MTFRTAIAVLTVLSLLCISCGDDKTTSPEDTTSPSAITDLMVTDSVGTLISLSWTAPGDDDTVGTATAYDLRWSTEPITSANWDSATQVVGEPIVAAAGTVQTITVNDLTWWTRYHFALRTQDDAGNLSDISNVAAASPTPPATVRLLVQTRDGVFSVAMDGSSTPFPARSTFIEVWGGHVYMRVGRSTINEYNLDGTLSRTIPIPDNAPNHGFAALPGNRFAIFGNRVDTVFFIDDNGSLLAASAMLPEPDNTLQSMNGVVVGNDLIISDDGQNHLLRADLDTYQIDVFRDMSSFRGWLGAIDYSDGVYCICQATRIYHFTEDGPINLVATLSGGNIVGAVIMGGHTFVTVNFEGKILRVNNTTGEIVTLLEGLNRPQYLELLSN